MSHDDEKERPRPDPARTVEVAIRGKKFVEFIHHAIDQMTRRGMTEQEVLKTLGDPDEIKATSVEERKAAFRNFGTLSKAKVVFEEQEDRFRVITVMWIKRRLSGRG